MSAALVLLLLAFACLLYAWPSLHWPGQESANRKSWKPRRRHTGALQEASMSRLVRELAALLLSGRSGPTLWAALAETLIEENHSRFDGSKSQNRPHSGTPPGAGDEIQGRANATLRLIRSAETASELGLPVAGAIRAACHHAAAQRGGGRVRGVPQPSKQHLRSWQEVAACFEVCEASGAPVAAVLDRLAQKLDGELDAQALRETALAGPKVTVRLLSALPFVGLGLGMTMGVDPLGVLLGSFAGWLCLVLGLVLAALGRWWSAALISRAAGTGAKPGFRNGLLRARWAESRANR